MEAIGHPSIKKQIHRSFERGAIVAGTSAGAAVMSGVMITGDQRLEPEYESTYRRLRANNAVYAEGLGLLPNAIVDQHFVERSRYNRAITALHDYPEQTVFGIGESTALVVTSTGMEAIGEGQIVVFRNGALSASPDGRIEGDLSIEIWVGH
jgi:cyanophycinase